VRVGKTADPRTSVSTATATAITVRGFDLCGELIGRLTFTEMFYLILTGARPTADQRFLLDATLVAIAEHGLTPNVQASRMTLAAAPDAVQAAVAAGILGCGSVVLGSSEAAGQRLARAVADVAEHGRSLDAFAAELAADYHQRGARLPGFGHPLHTDEDPRATRLLTLADERGTAGAHVAMLRAIARAAAERWRRIPLNVSSAIPAVLLDVGFPLEALKGVPILARTAGILAHLREEMQRPIGFHLAEHAEKAVRYDGGA